MKNDAYNSLCRKPAPINDPKVKNPAYVEPSFGPKA